ncbi:cytochrome P450 71A1-like [Triticum dicoccoides]|uniref:cytochrome P450 71A1-like n=1 Tax=Triticum dicoccoides TaxID=85692 RepID=UPI000E790D27|nr:cytochrome P450 71A1-like [Triticum dicoccoides]
MDASSPFASLHSPLLFLALLVPIFVSFLLVFAKKPGPSRDNGGARLPPSPWGLPVLGHLPLLGSLPHRKLRSLAEAHGPVMLLRLGGVPTVVASSADTALEVMKTHDLAFASRPAVRMAERLLYGRDMAFAPYGQYWRQARRVCVLHLLSARRVASFRRVREQEAGALVDRVRRAACSSRPEGNVVNLTDELISYTSSVISRAAFGDEGGYGIDDDLTEVFAEFEELLGTATVGEFVPWLAWVDTLMGLDAKVARARKVMDGLLERVISDHRQRRLSGGRRLVGDGEDDHRDFVDVLLDVSEDDGEDSGGVRFDTVGIKAIILDMFAAATDTTHTTLTWAVAELINNPSEMHKLQAEIRAAVNGAGHVTEDHLEKMSYLRAVIRETLRLHAPLPLLLPRETLEDTELLGYRVPARTRVVVNAWAIGRDPATWERAEEFVPARFADGPAEYVLGQDFRFVPFGAGRRGCPGVGFAVPSIDLALASLLYHFDLELPPAAAAGASKLDMSELYGLSVRLKATLHLVAKPWSP